jgi:DHA3 family tetracycline resistance protein-like MFS transporter
MAVVLFLVIYSLGEVSDPLLLAWMNQRLDPDVRATILSLVGQAESIGQAVGGLLVGFLANLLTVPLALLSVSVLLMPVLGFIHRSNRLVGSKDG